MTNRKIGRAPKKEKTRIPTIHCQVLWLLVSGSRVDYEESVTWTQLLLCRSIHLFFQHDIWCHQVTNPCATPRDLGSVPKELDLFKKPGEESWENH